MKKMKARLDIEEYGKRICTERCEYYKKTKEFKTSSVEEHKQKWEYLFHKKCVDCPLEAMIQCLREERDQNMKIEYECDVEFV